jgi:hypothetical protein
MIIVAIILLIIAVICFFVGRSQAGRLSAMNAADTYTAQLLTDIHTRVTGTLGADALAQACEVEGVIDCDAPLSGPVSGTTCVAYSYTVTREYEEDVTKKDEKGKVTTSTERRSETVQSEDRRVNFWVRDATGRTLVCPDGAELDLAETGDRYDAARKGGAGRTRTLGHKHVEQSLPVGAKVYVLGCAVDHEGRPMVGCSPRDKNLQFIISRRSERELAKSASSTAWGFKVAAGATGALGMILLVVGMI